MARGGRLGRRQKGRQITTLGRLIFASGAFTVAGATYVALLLRADAACSEYCEGPDLTPFVAQGVVVLAIGLALGAVDRWAGRPGRG